jgi:type IV pilus assembly protein PilW
MFYGSCALLYYHCQYRRGLEKMKFNFKRNSTLQAGFTLIEIMVGLVLGLLVALVVAQVMSTFESQKRTTSGTADAQTNGSIALYNISRELQLAGYPLMPTGVAGTADSPLECTTVTYGATGITSITPVSITNGTSDTVAIRYGDSQSGGVPTIIGAVVGNVVSVTNNFGCTVGNIAIVSNGATCALSGVTAVTGTVAPMTVTLNNITSAAVGGNLACLGAWNTVTYAVNNGNLERNGVPVVAGVVSLQAQYGISTTANSNQVNRWVDATAATGFAAPTVADRNRIKAVRIAIVARNSKVERAAVTSVCSSTSAASPTGLCAWAGVAVGGAITTASPAPTVDLSADANWARYHYRVFETIIPLRNMVWSRETL